MVTTSRVPSARCSVSPRSLRDGHDASDQAARRGRAERHDHLRLHDRALLIEPPLAALDLVGVRLLVQPALAARLELEVLHRIGDEGLVARNAGIGERPIEQLPAGPTNGLPARSSLSPGCSPTSIDARMARPLARHRLGGVRGRAGSAGTRFRPRAALRACAPPGRRRQPAPSQPPPNATVCRIQLLQRLTPGAGSAALQNPYKEIFISCCPLPRPCYRHPRSAASGRVIIANQGPS